MRVLQICIVLLFSLNSLKGQKEYNLWYFGDDAGINFNTIPPSSIANARIHTFESSTSMCDSNGSLLFYTDGDTVYNRSHQPMLNWKTNRSYSLTNSAEQGSMALKVPGSDHLYFVFHGLATENTWVTNDSMLRYRVIDMKGDGGLGEVILKDKPLFQGRSENFAVTLHANGTDYWIGAIDAEVGKYYKFNSIRTSNGSFTTPVIQQDLAALTRTGSYFTRATGHVKFSPDSRTLYLRSVYFKENGNSYNSIYLTLCKFDNASGLLSNFLPIKLGDESKGVLGAGTYEFSPDSRLLYLEVFEGDDRNIYQFDISVWDSAIISSSRQLIHSVKYNAPGYSDFRQFQTGPDGKIYCFQNMELGFRNDRLSVIQFPNRRGTACSFTYRSQQLTKGVNHYGGPYYPAFWFRNWKVDLGSDTILCVGDSLLLRPVLQSGSAVKWNTGDSTESIMVRKQGVYSVVVLGPFGTEARDTIIVKTGVKPKVYIGNDTAFCGQFSHLIKAGDGYKSYTWNTGDLNVQITVNTKGIYSVKVLDSNACPSGDTIHIDEIPKPILHLNYDSVLCRYVYLSVDTLKGLGYLWNTGETTQTISVTKKGWYSIKASHKFCNNMDSVLVDKLSKPEVDLGPDTALCANRMQLLLRAGEQGTYLWNTMADTDSLLVKTAGQYWLKVSRNNCISSDTILVHELPTPKVDLGPDISVCAVSAVLSSTDTGQYLWSDGSSLHDLLVNRSGKYWLYTRSGLCSNSDTILVNLFPVPQVDLGPDTNLCSHQLFLGTKEKGNYLWSTMETRPSILISIPGTYWLKVSNDKCSAADTIEVSACEEMTYYVPNAFSPDGDLHNDVFRVVGSHIFHIEMEIYNRWGEKLLSTEGNDVFWDGTYKQEPCQESVYFYRLVLKGRKPGDVRYLNGTVTLLR